MGNKLISRQMTMSFDKPLSNLYKGVFLAIFFSTGFSALLFQIIWQRVLALHAGVDLYSITTVVAAFMAGVMIGKFLTESAFRTGKANKPITTMQRSLIL